MIDYNELQNVTIDDLEEGIVQPNEYTEALINCLIDVLAHKKWCMHVGYDSQHHGVFVAVDPHQKHGSVADVIRSNGVYLGDYSFLISDSVAEHIIADAAADPSEIDYEVGSGSEVIR